MQVVAIGDTPILISKILVGMYSPVFCPNILPRMYNSLREQVSRDYEHNHVIKHLFIEFNMLGLRLG